jgi:hypothetical protein
MHGGGKKEDSYLCDDRQQDWCLVPTASNFDVQDDIDAWPLRHQDTNLFGQHFRLSPISPSFLLSCLIT